MNDELLELSYKKPTAQQRFTQRILNTPLCEEMHFALFTKTPEGFFKELEGGGYCSQKVDARGGKEEAVKFPQATSDWPTIFGYGYKWGSFTEIRSMDQPIALKTGDTLNFTLTLSYG